MSIGMVILTVAAVLVFFGVAQRVLDRMHLTDRMALLLIAAMFAGTFVPNMKIGRASFNVGGGLIPFGVCVYLFAKADSGKERLRAALGSLLTGAAVYALSAFLPNEPEQMWLEPNLIYGLAGGLIAYLLGRSRRCAFICGVVGVMLADIATACINWSKGINQQLVLGGAGLGDTVVISGILAVLLAELVGEIIEGCVRRRKGSQA